MTALPIPIEALAGLGCWGAVEAGGMLMLQIGPPCESTSPSGTRRVVGAWALHVQAHAACWSTVGRSTMSSR